MRLIFVIVNTIQPLGCKVNFNKTIYLSILNRKFSHSNHFILQKNLPACRTEPFFENTDILRWDVQVLDHILTKPILYWTWKDWQLLPQMPAQPGLLYRWDLQGGGRQKRTACKYQADISGNSQPIATVIATVYITLA